jgi:hypothetical protein
LVASGDFQGAIKEIEGAIRYLRERLPAPSFVRAVPDELASPTSTNSAPTMNTGLLGESNHIAAKTPFIPKKGDD